MTACWRGTVSICRPRPHAGGDGGVIPLDAGARKLSPKEREIIYQLYVLEKSEREASAALHLAQTTFRRRKKALLEKLRTLLDKNS